jgi:hypothetical protein
MLEAGNGPKGKGGKEGQRSLCFLCGEKKSFHLFPFPLCLSVDFQKKKDLGRDFNVELSSLSFLVRRDADEGYCFQVSNNRQQPKQNKTDATFLSCYAYRLQLARSLGFGA